MPGFFFEGGGVLSLVDLPHRAIIICIFCSSLCGGFLFVYVCFFLFVFERCPWSLDSVNLQKSPCLRLQKAGIMGAMPGTYLWFKLGQSTEGKRGRETAGWWAGEMHTKPLAVCHRCDLWRLCITTVVMSETTDRQIAMIDTIIRTSVVLGQLPTHDRDRWAPGFGRMVPIARLM